MSILFKQYLRSFLWSAIVAIFIALVIAGIVWILGYMFGASVPFLLTSRYVYFGLLLLDVSGKVKAFFSGWLLLRRTIKRFGVSKDDAAQGLFVHQFHKKDDFATWVDYEFLLHLHLSQGVDRACRKLGVR